MKLSRLARIGGLLLIGLSPLLFPLFAVYQVLSGVEGTTSLATPVDCAIVFGAAVHSVSDPGPAILRRVQTATELYHAGKVHRLIFSGGKGSEHQQSEAEVMQGVALSQGVSPASIAIETQSNSTWENVHNVLPLLQNCDSTIGISDDYHLARIELIAWRQGLSLSTYPAETARGRFRTQSIVREIFGYMYYLVMKG